MWGNQVHRRAKSAIKTGIGYEILDPQMRHAISEMWRDVNKWLQFSEPFRMFKNSIM